MELFATGTNIPRVKSTKRPETLRFKIMEALGDGKILPAPKKRKAETEPETKTCRSSRRRRG